MPELPEVEIVVRTLKKSFFINSFITKVEILKGKNFQNSSLEEINEKLIGQKVETITRKGKWIFIHLTNLVLSCHLRMTGNFFFSQDNFSSIIFFLDKNQKIFFHDPWGFGKIYLQTFEEWKKFSKEIGVDAISDEFTEEYLFSAIKKEKRKINIKTFLLDQTLISGIGNIYATEILFSVKIHPLTLIKNLDLESAKKIVFHTKRILGESIECGGTSVISWVSPILEKGRYQEKLKVYNRNDRSCYLCYKKITSFRISGRITFVCEECQTPPLITEN